MKRLFFPDASLLYRDEVPLPSAHRSLSRLKADGTGRAAAGHPASRMLSHGYPLRGNKSPLCCLQKRDSPSNNKNVHFSLFIQKKFKATPWVRICSYYSCLSERKGGGNRAAPPTLTWTTVRAQRKPLRWSRSLWRSRTGIQSFKGQLFKLLRLSIHMDFTDFVFYYICLEI